MGNGIVAPTCTQMIDRILYEKDAVHSENIKTEQPAPQWVLLNSTTARSDRAQALAMAPQQVLAVVRQDARPACAPPTTDA